MSNVFDVTEKYLAILQQIEELEGEMTPDIEQQVIGIKTEVEDRLRSYRYFIKYKEADINLLKSEIEHLNGKIKFAENAIIRVKKIVDMILNVFGEDTDSGNKRLKFASFSVWNKQTKAVHLSEDFLDFKVHPNHQKYGRYKLSIELPFTNHSELVKEIEAKGATLKADVFAPDKEMIKDTLSSGIVLAGASLVTNSSIQFK
jgi:hypothetical protein